MYCEEVCIAASVLCNGWMMGDENCAALRVEHKSSKTLRSNRFWNDMDCNRPFEILSKGQKQKHNSHTLVYGILNLFLMMWQWLERSNPLGKGVNSCAKWKPASRKKSHHPCTVQLFPSMLPTHPNMEPVPIYIIRWLCGASPLIHEHCFPGTLFIYSDDCVPLKYKQLFLDGVGSYFKQQFVNTVRNIHLRTQSICAVQSTTNWSSSLNEDSHNLIDIWMRWKNLTVYSLSFSHTF